MRKMGSATIQGSLWNHNPSGWNIQERLHIPIFEAMLTAANVSVGTRFLDAGCGTGTASVLAAARGAIVTGIDAAEGLIAYVSKAVPDGSFTVGDIQSFDFPDESFDVVFAANSVQYAEDPLAALGEFKRVCKKGGTVVACLFGPPEGIDYKAVFAAAKAAMPPSPADAKPGGPFALSAPGILEALFKESGFDITDTGKANCPFTYDNFEQKWKYSLGAGPFQGMMKVIGAIKMKQALQLGCKDFTNEDGNIVFPTNEFIYVAGKAMAD
jgi:SAM-dependent methyltransferase